MRLYLSQKIHYTFEPSHQLIIFHLSGSCNVRQQSYGSSLQPLRNYWSGLSAAQNK